MELPKILSVARAHNSEHGITGILCFAYGRYMQVLEGGAKEVNALYLKIGADKRQMIGNRFWPVSATRARGIVAGRAKSPASRT